jgi:tetrahydromethanopterin S-methyltransferase subunit B
VRTGGGLPESYKTQFVAGIKLQLIFGSFIAFVVVGIWAMIIVIQGLVAA